MMNENKNLVAGLALLVVGALALFAISFTLEVTLIWVVLGFASVLFGFTAPTFLVVAWFVFLIDLILVVGYAVLFGLTFLLALLADA